MRSTQFLLSVASAIVGLGLLAGPAHAALGDVLHTIPCPGDNPADLAWVDGILYSVIFSPAEQRGIYRLDPQTGDILGMVPYAGLMPQGLAYDGHNLWQVCLTNDRIYKLDPLSGAVRDSFQAPDTPNTQPIGLGWDGAALWLADSRDPEKIWQLDSLGTVLGQIPAPGDSPYGLAWAEGFIWVSDNNTSGGAYIYKLDPQTGEILDSFLCPGGGGAPNGITHDGENLWIAENLSDTIYEVDDGIGGSAVTEAGLGQNLPLEIVMLRTEPHCGAIDIQFAADKSGEIRVQLLDIQGRQRLGTFAQVTAPGCHGMRLGAADVPSGLYWVRLSGAGSTVSGRIMLAR